jgi:hypothetical protein
MFNKKGIPAKDFIKAKIDGEYFEETHNLPVGHMKKYLKA